MILLGKSVFSRYFMPFYAMCSLVCWLYARYIILRKNIWLIYTQHIGYLQPAYTYMCEKEAWEVLERILIPSAKESLTVATLSVKPKGDERRELNPIYSLHQRWGAMRTHWGPFKAPEGTKKATQNANQGANYEATRVATLIRITIVSIVSNYSQIIG